MKVKRSTMQVAAAVAVVAGVENEEGVQWRRWGGHSMVGAAFDGATQQLAGAQREAERVAQQEATHNRVVQ